MTSIREIALREPLVDVVESHNVVTNSARVKVDTSKRLGHNIIEMFYY